MDSGPLIVNHTSETNFGWGVFGVGINHQGAVLIADFAFGVEGDVDLFSFTGGNGFLGVEVLRTGAGHLYFSDDQGLITLI